MTKHERRSLRRRLWGWKGHGIICANKDSTNAITNEGESESYTNSQDEKDE